MDKPQSSGVNVYSGCSSSSKRRFERVDSRVAAFREDMV